MIYKHFLITRFNIPHSFDKDKNGDDTKTDSYMEKRICLFETFCLPSVQNQSNKDFVWFVYFDKHSPQMLMDKIKSWERACSVFMPKYVVDYDEWQKHICSEDIISAVDGHNVEYIITTRLDNDDALGKNAIQEIQNHFISQDNTIIDLVNGACYDEENHIFSMFRYNGNPFISYIEKKTCELPSTVYRKKHNGYGGDTNITTILTTDPMWMQVISNTNILNQMSYGRCLCSIGKDKFGCVVAINKAQCLKGNMFYLLSRIKKIIKKLFT